MICNHCGTTWRSQEEACPTCKLPANFDETNPIYSLFKHREFRQNRIYPLFLIIGTPLLVLFYLYFSDIKPMFYGGFATLLFSFFGYITERMVSIAGQTENGTMREAFKIWLRDLAQMNIIFEIIVSLIVFPIYFFNILKPLVISFACSLFWTVVVFFVLSFF